MCSKYWVALLHTMSYALWAKRKQVIATLLGRLTCHPMREQNCLGGKIFRAGLQFNNKVTVGNPFSRRGGSLCYVHVLKKYPANVNIK